MRLPERRRAFQRLAQILNLLLFLASPNERTKQTRSAKPAKENLPSACFVASVCSIFSLFIYLESEPQPEAEDSLTTHSGVFTEAAAIAIATWIPPLRSVGKVEPFGAELKAELLGD